MMFCIMSIVKNTALLLTNLLGSMALICISLIV